MFYIFAVPSSMSVTLSLCMTYNFYAALYFRPQKAVTRSKLGWSMLNCLWSNN